VLLVAVAAAVLFLDMTLARGRTTRQWPAKPGADCSAPAAASTAARPPQPAVPPGFAAAFGACGDESSKGDAASKKDR
jgi:hypothetical protein